MVSGTRKWKERQRKDIYVKKSRLDNYRCRSAYKLLEIDERYKVFRTGDVVIDLGCAPGSWCQVAVDKVGSAAVGKSQLLIIFQFMHSYIYHSEIENKPSYQWFIAFAPDHKDVCC